MFEVPLILEVSNKLLSFGLTCGLNQLKSRLGLSILTWRMFLLCKTVSSLDQ
jgi:hypothetical protein